MERPDPQTIPITSGVYLYKDKQNKIIYVGKAIHLRKRVLSYFRSPDQLTPKTVLMLSKAITIDTISTNTEKEALLLEASLIKKHKPRFNIVLRDDKQYVLYKFSVKDPYPRLEITRSIKKDNARYYGPFTSGASAKETWKNIHRIFPLRRCNDRAFQNRVRPCLYYYIHQCLGPCTENVPQEAYQEVVHQVILLLSGKSHTVKNQLKKDMEKASFNLDFEQAAQIRDQIQDLEKTLEKQSTVLPHGGDIDIIGIVENNSSLSLGIIFVRNGMMIDSRNFFWQDLTEADTSELLISFLSQYYTTAYIPPIIILPFMPKAQITEEEQDEISFLAESLSAIRTQQLNLNPNKSSSHIRIRLPKNSEENKLIEIARKNAEEYAKQRQNKNYAQLLSYVFKVDYPINTIECVDVSHTSGKSTKVGMVVFEQNKEAKNQYRAWNIEAEGDDYKALSEWATQRVERSLNHKAPFPDLLLIDGGKGQLTVVEASLKKALQQQNLPTEIPFILASIAKARDEDGKTDRRAGNTADRIFIPNRSNPLNLRQGCPELLYLQKIRDTAHNYSISKHRKARTKLALQSQLSQIKGISTKTTQLVWQHFNSIEEIKNATWEDFLKLPLYSEKKAKKLQELIKKLEE